LCGLSANAGAPGALAFDTAQAAWNRQAPGFGNRIVAIDAHHILAGAGGLAFGREPVREARTLQLVRDDGFALGHLAAACFIQGIDQCVSFVLSHQSIQPAVLIWQSRYNLAVSMWFVTAFCPGCSFGSGGHFTKRFACGGGGGLGVGVVPTAQAVSVKHAASARVLV
jgi:hypothetical protein